MIDVIDKALNYSLKCLPASCSESLRQETSDVIERGEVETCVITNMQVKHSSYCKLDTLKQEVIVHCWQLGADGRRTV